MGNSTEGQGVPDMRICLGNSKKDPSFYFIPIFSIDCYYFNMGKKEYGIVRRHNKRPDGTAIQ
jgi:hypothetical protein